MKALFLITTLCVTGCFIEPTTDPDDPTSPDDPTDPDDPDDPDDPGDPTDPTSCTLDDAIGRVWEFSSNNTFFFLKLNADGTYRREMDSSSNVLCEYGQWRTTTCGTIEFQTCRGTVEQRAWSGGSSSLRLDQSTYFPSSLNEATAFSFCDPTECD